MRFWKNSVKGANLSHMIGGYYYFVDPYSLVTNELVWDGRYRFYRCPKNDDIFDEWETSKDNIDIMLAKIDEFKRELENAKVEQDGFIAVRFTNNSVLYYKHIEKARYQFIVVDDEIYQRIYNRKTTPAQFLSEFCPLILSYGDSEGQTLAMEDSPFYISAKKHDTYLSAEIDYFCGNINKETIDRINSVRQMPVFFVEKKIYDIDDIEKIEDIERGRISFFNRATYYTFKVRVENKSYKAEWWPTEKELRMNCYEQRVKITDALHEKIEILTGETNEQRKTRKLLQLENYRYSYKDGLSRLPLEKRNEIFEQMGQVSVEDLKSLPEHHLKRLTVAQLYDWLHCSGNTGNPKAVVFIEYLVKIRKEKYKN